MKTGPTVYLICGFIGAGKTTFARDLESNTNAVRITKDEWSIQLIGNDPKIDGYEDHDRKIIELSRQVAFNLIEKNIDVIWDEGFWDKHDRLELVQHIHEKGATAVLYYLDTPVELMRKRVEKRNQLPGNHSFIISEEMFTEYLKFWKPPEGDEDFITIAPNG